MVINKDLFVFFVNIMSTVNYRQLTLDIVKASHFKLTEQSFEAMT